MTQIVEQGLKPLEAAAIAMLPGISLPLIEATPENTAGFGLYFGGEVPESGLSIPFYKGSVQEGHNFNFEYRGEAVIRSAKIGKRNPQLDWLERHLHLTQFFVPLGTKGYILVLAPPNHADGKNVPDLDKAKAFVFPPGVGFMLHKGTWHDFPFPSEDEVTVFTGNSAEVVQALVNCPEPRELFEGDVYKINIPARLGVRLVVELPA
jgi:ureidoglycolate lyase